MKGKFMKRIIISLCLLQCSMVSAMNQKSTPAQKAVPKKAHKKYRVDPVMKAKLFHLINDGKLEAAQKMLNDNPWLLAANEAGNLDFQLLELFAFRRCAFDNSQKKQEASKYESFRNFIFNLAQKKDPFIYDQLKKATKQLNEDTERYMASFFSREISGKKVSQTKPKSSNWLLGLGLGISLAGIVYIMYQKNNHKEKEA